MFLIKNHLYRSDTRPCGGTKTTTSTAARHLFSILSPSSVQILVQINLSLSLSLSILLLLLSANQVPSSNAQQVDGVSLAPPTFLRDMNSLTIKENSPIGTQIYKLQAKLELDNVKARILYGIHGTKLFEVDKLNGVVKVAQQIDREQTSDSVTFHVSATPVIDFAKQPIYGQPANISTTVLIVDENDNPPKITRVRTLDQDYEGQQLYASRYNVGSSSSSRGLSPAIIRVNVSESAPLGSVIVDPIEAQDLDKSSEGQLKAICQYCEPEFELKELVNDRLDGLNVSLVLARQLVHSPRDNIRQLSVIVTDGKYNTSIMIEITIENVQNRPPQFIGSSTCIVRENVPIDTTIMTLQAIDGDTIAQDDIASSMMKGGGRLSGGREILYELLGEDQPVTRLFKLHPLTGQLQVADRLNREAFLGLDDRLRLRVKASEITVPTDSIVRLDETYGSIIAQLKPSTDPSPEGQAEIDVTVILMDFNDNVPHWLNASEIALLNLNHSSNWFENLPNDRDPGRHYTLQVRENSPAGSPITLQNQMFVYDLDSGENANFEISLKSDEFHLFDVEPKRVSGFAMITLKLAGASPVASRQQLMLDYEDQNRRNFIVELVATETNTLERHSSKAQIHIEVLDMNDNAPEFSESAYSGNLREDAPAGSTILRVKARDRDEVSQNLSFSLHGVAAKLFNIDQSGSITLAECRPDLTNCIDFEHQRTHHLMVSVSDGELFSKVPLTIHVEDASDNGPIFKLPVLDVVIEEGSSRLDPPIKIEATDVDQSSVLSYSIVEGNFEGLFSIDNATGEIQLTRPIRISHDESAQTLDDAARLQQQQPMNKMILIVQATDGDRVANGTIRIDVLDANDNSPRFAKSNYTAEISELAAPGQFVARVYAADADRGNNAQVTYRIVRGSYGQFEIDESSGVIAVAKSGPGLDASKRSSYALELVAQDSGLVSRSTSVMVHINVLDNISRPPEFRPQIQRVSAMETLLNNTIIHRMLVSEEELRDTDKLIFEPGPIEALDKDGQPVHDSERLEQMFSVSDRSGDILIHSGLDHDFAAHINLTVYVSLRPMYDSYQLEPTANNGQTNQQFSRKSVGYVVINVLDYNDNAPIFAPPWSAQAPELSFQMLEELPVGSVLAHLTASDADSKISHFKIDPPNEYFELASPHSGVIVNKKLIDYDALMSQTFRLPSASYRVLTPAQTTTLNSLTTAASNGISSSSSSTTTTTVPNNNNIIQFNVHVFDSGSPQLSTKATVSVEILPVNDWDCRFEQALYDVRIRENTKPDTLLVQVRAQDLDYGEQHSSIRYQLIGEHSELFNIDPKTGLITVSTKGSIELDRERLSRPSFTMTVLGRDEQQQIGQNNKSNKQQQQQTHRTCSATIRVNVEDVNDNPPLFSQQLYEVTAYDTDIPRVPLVDLIVRDFDQSAGGNNKPVNSFKIISGNVNDIFSVSNTGVLYTTKLLNESLKYPSEPIQLRVQVRQTSPGSTVTSLPLLTSFTDECLVKIKYVQINRNGPEWRLDQSKSMVVVENSEPGTEVTQLRCYDRDLDPKASRLIDPSQMQQQPPASSPIRYWIKEDGVSVSETREFKLDPVTGRLVTRRELDRETEEIYQLIVACEDNGKPQSLENVIPIYVRVLDLDDNKPEFFVVGQQQTPGAQSSTGTPTISLTVEERQSRGLPVGELKAIDRDLENPNPIQYCLMEGNNNQEFSLDRLSGILYTNQSLDREQQSSYDLLVEAINDGSTCESRGSQAISANASSGPGSLLWVKIEVLDINDNAPTFRRPIHRAGVHHRALMNTLVTQVAALDPDSGLNGSMIYKISEILMYKTSVPAANQPGSSRIRYDVERSEPPPLSKPIKLIQSPFRVDQLGNIYTQQLLTQYHLMSMFVLQIEASEMAEPWRTATTRLEVYIYETGNQLKIRLNLHPRLVEVYRSDIETLFSNATKYTAIINRARSYYGSGSEPAISMVQQHQKAKSQFGSSRQRGAEDQSSPLSIGRDIQIQSNSISSFYPDEAQLQQLPSSTNVHLIFVDNFRIVNPVLVMEKIDLTSAELFTPKSLLSQLQQSSANFSSSTNQQKANLQQQQQQQQHDELRLAASEMSSLIDKVALASAVQSADYLTGGGSILTAINWLENPAILIVALSAVLTLFGFIVCLFGCCCTSRIKDHIVKVAMDKLVKQQAMQAKINEQVLAATNQSFLGQGAGQSPNGADYLLQQGGFISAFDATKGCISNNNENMSILQRAMQDSGGEFIDPNYTTLNWQANIGAHYYDTSELDEGGMCGDPNGNLMTNGGKQFEESRASVSLGDEDDYDDDEEGDLNNATQTNGMATSKVVNGNGIVNATNHNQATNNNNNHHQRQRQQVPLANKLS